MLPSPRDRLTHRWVVWAGIGVVIAVVAWFATLPRNPEAPAIATVPEQDSAVTTPPVRNPGYVGPQACAPCHADRVAEFRTTRHFLACCTPQTDTTPAELSRAAVSIVTQIPNLRFEMSWRNGELLQTAIQNNKDGDRQSSSRVDLVYGGGGSTDEVYFTWHGNRLFELPAVWLHPLEQLGTSPFNPHGSGEFSREATVRCVECHNTWFPHVAGTLNEYERDNPILGVTCEKCHGPGQEHVAYHESNPHATEPASIVRPARLTRERQLDLCAQCHSNAIKPRRPAFSYRPGEPLDDYFKTITTQHPEQDHVANQTQYLRQSKCFQNSDTLTCTTCHDPHRPVGQTAGGSASCSKCHPASDCTDRDRLPADVQDRCVACHMPQLDKVQVYFQTTSDAYLPLVKRFEHRIAVHPAARQKVLLEWYRTRADAESRAEASRLAKSLGEHYQTQAETCRKEYRFLAAIDACRGSLQFDPNPATRDQLRQLLQIQSAIDNDFLDAVRQIEERRYPAAIETLTKILALKPDLAKAHGRLGTSYAVVGKKQLAAEHLQAAADCDPDDPYGQSMLGWLAFLDGRHAEALDHYERADAAEPYSARINYHIGLALAKLGCWPEAVERFQKTLEIDPKHAAACYELSLALRQQRRTSEALRFGLRAVELTGSKDAEVLMSVAELYADRGRYADAHRTASRALNAAPATNQQLVQHIRSRAETFRVRQRGEK